MFFSSTDKYTKLRIWTDRYGYILEKQMSLIILCAWILLDMDVNDESLSSSERRKKIKKAENMNYFLIKIYEEQQFSK